MTSVKIFENPEFGKVRVVDQNGEPWFAASDIAKALGYANPQEATREHCKKVNKITQPSESLISVNRPPVYINIIPESDVYRLVMRSNLPSAERFQDWVCEEVLPSIRKTGGYGTVALPNFSDPVEAARAWADKEEQRRLEEHAKLMALETIEVQKPLVQIAEERIDKKGCFSITDVNRSLGLKRGERKVSEVIRQAMLRCFSGKGKERHNIEGTVDFMDQPLMEISRRVGIGGPLYQVHKKAYEAHDMVRKGDSERARNELLDIIIYTAATVLLLDEQKEDK